MDNEKKFKLEELPNSGSEPDKIIFFPVKKKILEPRLENLKKMNASEMDEALSERWHFDKNRMRWGWLLFLFLLVGLQKSKILLDYHQKIIRIEKPADRLSALIFDNSEFDFLVKYPLIFAVFIPMVFKFKESSKDHFEITFTGISAVQTIDIPAFTSPKRVKMHWDEIKHVKKITVKGRPVLELSHNLGPGAQLIWDIADIKKKVVKQVLSNLVSVKHPMRIFIEKEVT
jgi:hypothetical protein